ncbi:uncharacterized protein Gasu_66050, partial [Galdieria sulphuraria]
LQTLNYTDATMSFFRLKECLSELPFTIEFSWSYFGQGGYNMADNTGVGFLMEGLPSGNGGYYPQASNGYYATYEFYAPDYPGVWSRNDSLTTSPYQILNYYGRGFALFLAYSKVEVSSASISMYYSGGLQSVQDSYNLPDGGIYRHYLEPSKYTGADNRYTYFDAASPSGGPPLCTWSGSVNTTNNNFYFASSCAGATSYQFFYWFRIRKGIALMQASTRQILNHVS